MRLILKNWYKLIGLTPDKMEMVQYWKTKKAIPAKVTKAEDGSSIMVMESEKYAFPTFPRGHLLMKDSDGNYPALPRIKHEIKNQVFNESWALLEEGKSNEEVVKHIKSKLFNEIAEIGEELKYDMLPVKKMTPSVREIHRAWTKVAPQSTYQLRDYLCFILQEDDAYRMRVQWLVPWFGFIRLFSPVRAFRASLRVLEHAEVIGDMKERIRLLRRVLLVALEDKTIRKLFNDLFREIDWKKVKLTKADKYHFRGKYFKVDYGLFDY